MTPSRIPDDPRVMQVLQPDASKAVTAWLERKRKQGDTLAPASYKKAMQFEKMFFDAGGLLAAGSDPCCLSVTAGYARSPQLRDPRRSRIHARAGGAGDDVERRQSTRHRFAASAP